MEYKSLNDFFSEVFDGLSCRSDTRSYIIGLFSQYRSTTHDLSKSNLSLMYLQARQNYDFYAYQQVADWIFFSNIAMPGHLRDAGDYYENIARLSYYSCYKMVNRQWVLYQELADQFVVLEREAKEKLLIHL